jgi:uncharacterized protein (DUF58 family)
MPSLTRETASEPAHDSAHDTTPDLARASDAVSERTTSRSRPHITQTGLIVVTAGVAMTFLGFAFGYVAFSVAGTLVLLATMLAAITTFSVPTLEVERVVEPRRVARGNAAHGLVSVKNAQSRPSRACTAYDRFGARSVAVDIPSLRSRRSIVVSYELPTQRRGEMIVGPLAIRRTDPLGLFVASRTVGTTASVLVEPKIFAVDPRPSGRLRHLEGPRSDKSNQGTMTFHSLREYTRGDDIRQVHWRSSARTGTLMVREHVDTSLPSTVIVLDTCTYHYNDDLFEEAVDVASSIAAASQGRNFPVRFLTTSGVAIVVRAGQRGQELRNLLSTVAADEHGSIPRTTGKVLHGHDHDTIVVVGGDIDTTDVINVSAMARRFSTPVLITLRENIGTRWNLGLHLDSNNAATILEGWQLGAPIRSTTGTPTGTQ